jgi:hypothetical protein
MNETAFATRHPLEFPVDLGVGAPTMVDEDVLKSFGDLTEMAIGSAAQSRGPAPAIATNT